MVSIETKLADQSAGGKKSIDAEMRYEDGPLQAARKDGVASFQAMEIGNENGCQTSLVHVTSYRSTKNKRLPVDRVVRNNGIDVNGDAAKFVEERDLRKELNYTLEYCCEDEVKEHIFKDDDNSDEDDKCDESEHRVRASISRKVWQFFTS
ncbi:hypothetical protein HAX54_008103 [Datura stramonium]|uniref:Uncharacterized protein n=1 Tax=Datura stramonium TaxID=4076 RepID=A0ABS8TFA5_DATST|nr:hypothetical protein [Datura stramonium]